jgi:ribonuclease BN (tRNA processing enzyme)
MLHDILFLGVGEACDPEYPNTSLLLRNGSQQGVVLLDCGFTTPHLYFQRCTMADELKALWISHFHGDHFFGVPLLLLRFMEMERRDPLIIIGPEGVEKKVCTALDLAYANVRENLPYTLFFHNMEAGSTVELAGLSWTAAESQHTDSSLAIRVADKKKSIFYSGDGKTAQEAQGLASRCDLIILEAFRVSGETLGHGSISKAIAFAKKSGAKNIALLHVNRYDRFEHIDQIQDILDREKDVHVFLPEPGDIYRL